MKIILKIILVVHGLTEISAGIIMMFFPQVFFDSLSEDIINLSRSFGVGALTVGILSFILLKFRHPSALKVGLITLILFQTGITILQIINPVENAPVWVAPLFHGSFVAGFLFFIFRIETLFRSESQ
jgi:xanthosine utilization system XapX-like protein